MGNNVCVSQARFSRPSTDDTGVEASTCRGRDDEVQKSDHPCPVSRQTCDAGAVPYYRNRFIIIIIIIGCFC